jgi:predicted nuclease of predicted toxin-antitoxin system
VATELRREGLDVVDTTDVDPFASDSEVLALAYAEQRVLVTLDKDFGELVIVRAQAHCGVIRLVGFSAQEQASVLLKLVDTLGEEILGGGLVVASPERTRVRPRDRG